jgi:hypothetical protein
MTRNFNNIVACIGLGFEKEGHDHFIDKLRPFTNPSMMERVRSGID